MDIDPGDGPGVADDDPSPSDHLLLEYVRAGMPDAEVAVRLGLPTGEVKARIERLMWRPGGPGREQFRDNLHARAKPPDDRRDEPGVALRRSHDLHWRSAMLAVGLVLGTMLTVLVGSSRDDDGSRAATVPGQNQGGGEEPTATPTRKPGISAMDGIMVASAGEFFEVQGQLQPVARFSTRQDGVVAWLQGPGAIRLPGAADWRPTLRSAFVTMIGRLRDQSIVLTVQAGDAATRFLVASDNSVGVYSTATDQPVVLLRARTSDGQRLHVSVGRDGQLYIGKEPLFPSDVIDERTGELLAPLGYLLKPAGGLRLGVLQTREASYQFTWCEEGICWVGRGGARLTAPADGRLTCRADGILELDAGDFSLRFHKLIMGIGKREPSECTPPPSPQVRAGDEIAPAGQYVITAASSSGEPVSVAVALNGTVYVGKFAPSAECPCWGRT